MKGPPFVKSRVNIASRKVEDIKLLLDCVWQKDPKINIFEQHPSALTKEFDDDIYYGDRQLTIGYFDSQSLFESCSSIKRAILTSYGHLTSLGYELLKITDDLPYFKRINELALSLYFNLNFSSN